jgi:hypothetical protein
LRRAGTSNLILWGGIGVVAALAIVLLWTTGAFKFTNPRAVLTGTAEAFKPSPTATSTATPSSTPATEAAGVASATAVPVPTVFLPELPEVTPPPGGQVHSVTPAPDAVGWVREGDETPNHLGDYNIYAGVFDGRRHLGAIQFDFSPVISPGVSIAYADLTMVGLSEKWLGDEGTWTVQLLEPWMDDDWPQRTFADLAPDQTAAAGLEPALTAGDLGAGRANVFVLGSEALQALEARTFTGRVSFLIEGPASGSDSLFSWDGGYGSGSRGWKPVLRMAAGPAPESPPVPPTPHYVILTSVPTPENILTAAALAATATAQATTTGTATPLPPNRVTPIIIVPVATPENAATAQWHAAMATAQVSLYGTPTPLPPNAWTATPTGTPTATPTPQPGRPRPRPHPL